MLLNKKSISYQLSVFSGQQTDKLLQTNLLRKLFTVHYSLFTNKKGFTLVEVMVAMVLSLIIFLALMQTSLISMEHNTRNALRDEAVGIAGMRMEDARNLGFTQLVDDPNTIAITNCPSGFPTKGELVQRNIRSVLNFDFCTNREVDTIDSGTRRVTITVGWKWKGQGFTHAVSTVMRG